jgi:hypothetical protein
MSLVIKERACGSEYDTWDKTLNRWKLGHPPDMCRDRACSAVMFESSPMRASADGLVTGCIRTSLLPTPKLRRSPSSKTFKKHIEAALVDSRIGIAFDGINGPSQRFVIPTVPCTDIADFQQKCTGDQYALFWVLVATEAEAFARAHPDQNVYISTHGLGVPWLHIRIELVPKYYVDKSLKEYMA